jgi:predicted alpha/beta-fold hydrolase
MSSAPRDRDVVRKLFAEVKAGFDLKPFKALRLLSGAHRQTVGAYAWPRHNRLKNTTTNDEERLFQVEDGVQVLAQCRWQANKIESPTMVIWHGMEGSTSSVYMWSTADKAFRAGFNVVRVNYRNCGGTEHLTPTLYHGGMSADLNRVIAELIARDELKYLYPVGFSLGGNMVLKLLGEYGNHPPAEVIAAAVVSPSVDLKASTDLIVKRSNWLYHKNFVTSLKNRIRLKSQLFPERYDATKVAEIKSIREFDEVYTSKANGFANAAEYYYKASSVRVVDQIRVPTLIIHAEDDPFIPFGPLVEKAFVDNPYLLLVKTENGGHVAFISAGSKTEDRFWAENRVVEFCRLSEEVVNGKS